MAQQENRNLQIQKENLDIGVLGYQDHLFQADLIKQIKELERELEKEREANEKLNREFTIAKNTIEQMKQNAPKKAPKIEFGINYN